MKPTFLSIVNSLSLTPKTAFAAVAIITLCFATANPAALAQTVPPPHEPKVRGQIVNQDEKPVPGAAILVKGQTTGTASNVNGFFELNLSRFAGKDLTLTISFVNFTTKEVEIPWKKLPKDLGQIKLAEE